VLWRPFLRRGRSADDEEGLDQVEFLFAGVADVRGEDGANPDPEHRDQAGEDGAEHFEQLLQRLQPTRRRQGTGEPADGDPGRCLTTLGVRSRRTRA